MDHPRLKRHDLPGMLIAFEGIDGCGKGTQIEMLVDAFKREGWADRLVMNKQPGGTKLGAGIRELLFHTVTTHAIDPDAASLLYLASHTQALRDVVMPALEAGKIVISDRWQCYSDTAYGPHRDVRPISQNILDLEFALGGPEPDLLFFLHGDPQRLLDRAAARTSETHQAGKRWCNWETLEKIQEAYFRVVWPVEGLAPVCVHRSPAEIFEEDIWPAAFRAVRRHFGQD